MPSPKPPLESEIQKQCLNWLTLHGILAWRQNSGAMQGTYKGKARFVRFTSIQGVSDILACANDGTFIACEVKRPGGKLRPEQELFLAAVRKRGGVAIVAHSLDEMIAGLREAGLVE